MCHSPSGSFSLSKNKKGCFPSSKYIQLCLEPRHQTAATQMMTYILIFQVFQTHRETQMKGKEKGGLKTNKQKWLKRFFWHCTGLINFFNKYYLGFDNNFYLCPKCLKKESLSQHCSSVQTHHGPDLSWLLGFTGLVDNCQMTLKAFQSLGIKRSGQAVAMKVRKGISFVLSQCRSDVTVRHQWAEILWDLH